MTTEEVFMDALRRIADDAVARGSSAFRWARVTSVDPLRIHKDGDTAPVGTAPSNLAGPLAVDDRVYVINDERRDVVLGRGGPGLVRADKRDVNGGSIWLGKHEGPGSSEQSGIFLDRNLNGLERTIVFYNTASPNQSEWGIINREEGANHSRLFMGSDGHLKTQTYADSPLPTATRPLPFGIAAGDVAFSVTGGIGYVTVTFPAGMFTKIPSVFVTGNSAVNALNNVQVSNVTATTARIVLQRSTATVTTVYWLAVQMEP